ncbi:Histone deacetylase complex subunit SAP18 [Eumeta japonica]|uniref:18 kDa Sin3-associated polypeptide n=1 Tax=Eumeta variegata TaxID=151549 RepID=A0A4C1VV94_EUMVA|nr:Histone deacetylase complex subunit SAP18 [Eumeta japonica]
MAGMESMVVEEVKPVEKPVDREKTCPLLLRVFCSTGRHNSPADYARGNVPQNELQIYTWMDATLRELTSLVKEVNPETRRKGTYFDFAIVYPDMRSPTYRMREIGVTCSGQRAIGMLLPTFTPSYSDHLFKKGIAAAVFLSWQIGSRRCWRGRTV